MNRISKDIAGILEIAAILIGPLYQYHSKRCKGITKGSNQVWVG